MPVIQNSNREGVDRERDRDLVSPVHVTLLNVVISITNLCLGGVTLSALGFIHIFVTSTSLKQHVYLCVIGYVIIMTQAVHSLNPHSGWARMVKYENRRMVHWTLQIVATILVSIGSIIRMANVNTNFNSTHGILGIVAFLCTILTMIGGIVNANSSRLNINKTFLTLAHSCIGSLTLCSAFLSLCFAFNSIYRVDMGDKSANFGIALSVVALVGTLVSPSLDFVKRIFHSR
ncbi:unnamed protein product [Pieris brassicae]|uniref:ascorbate ferrireductase (transmembrane) n=1 Tax=Pieris brassicae TaxID=7116 RepID=A0A9P0XI03_PIEBR|nr:unnamed protein product [Pieris brassicae]